MTAGCKGWSRYLAEGPAVSEALGVADLHVAGSGHVIHCDCIKVSAHPCQLTLNVQRDHLHM